MAELFYLHATFLDHALRGHPAVPKSEFCTVACGPVLEPEWPTYYSDLATVCKVRGSIPCVGVVYYSVYYSHFTYRVC